MKSHRIGLFLGFLALAPLACLALSACKSSPYGSATAAGAEKAGPGGPATPARLVADYDALADQILSARKKEAAIVESILKAAHADAEGALGKARAAIKSGDKKAAQSSLEDLAASIGFLGTEGDSACARVRKRLVEGGHHFNPAGAPGAAQHHPAGHEPQHHAKPGAEGHAKAEGAPPAGEGAHHAKPGAEGHAKTPEGHAQHGAEHHAHAGGSQGFDIGYVVVSRGAKKTFLDASQAIAKLSTAPDAAALDAEWAKVETAWAGLWKAAK
jgi:hypothetical protein